MNKTITFIFTLLLSTTCLSDVYKWTDKDGKVHFSDKNESPMSETIKIKKHDSSKKLIKDILKDQAILNKQIEYAINIRRKNPEYGTRIPTELCDNGITKICKLPIKFIQNTLKSFKEAEINLTKPAWKAFKEHHNRGDVIWSFNLCRILWDENKPCVPVKGYILIRKGIVVFYAFIEDKENKKPIDLNKKEFVSIGPDSNKSRIISWDITEQNENSVIIRVKYFYDGEFDDTPIWISASTLNNGSRSGNDEVWPSKITKGEGVAKIKIKAYSKAPKKYCTEQIQFSLYGKGLSTFHKATVDFSKCWINNINPTKSSPTRGIN